MEPDLGGQEKPDQLVEEARTVTQSQWSLTLEVRKSPSPTAQGVGKVGG